MRVVSVFELRELSLRKAMKKLDEAEWVIDEDGLFYLADLYKDFMPAGEIGRFLQNSVTQHKNPENEARTVRA
ncbi:hypothetical protein APY94_02895 [Thermococcus celericrescens]|uniref:Uncharacterized protein n=1 Tax=Thermococcus celericrescens TaxID=227598 RepID=A0A100XYW5_9EURY|nr:hypothetical protein [Thermococcus celericrescens]KUH34237.1 hypothetical protein APY94_02895 [Thermococcus celericrescens]